MKPMPTPGPGYDPLDRIIQDVENIESFVSRLAENPRDLSYANSHLSAILRLRRAMNQQINTLSEAPYHYTASRLKTLHLENENIFLFLEGAVGAINPLNTNELQKMVKATKDSLARFEKDLTP